MGAASAGTLEAGERALARGDWVAARDAFATVISKSGSADAFDGLGRALWWLKDATGAIGARTRAYTALREDGRHSEAARVAVWLAREHRNLFRNHAQADGWLARARSAARQSADRTVNGWLALADAEASGAANRAIRRVRVALDYAHKQHDADLEIVALARLGALQVAAGHVEAGLACLDEAMTAATAGEGHEPASLGEACCAMVEVATLLGDVERIASWAREIDGFRAAYDFPPLAAQAAWSAPSALSAFCASCCGEVYLVTGRLDDAEKELTQAIAELERQRMYSRCLHPVTQLAEVRVLQGKLEEAEALLASFEDLPECTRPLAALDLARGYSDRAAGRLRARIAAMSDVPVATFPLWSLVVDADNARGDAEGAKQAAGELARIAAVTGSNHHQAEAAFAAAKVAVVSDEEAAPSALRHAARMLAQAGLPLSACRARLAYARAVAHADRGLAVAEARAAAAGFERLGANPDSDMAAAFLRELGVRGRTGPKDIGLLSRREQEVLRLIAEGLSNVEIAQRLYISVKTAGHHVSSILAKLGVRSRTEAAAFALLNLRRESGRE